MGRKTIYYVISAVVMNVCLFSVGCVERELTINTDPAGAAVILNDEEIGTTPVTVGFNWYGDYNVKITKDGYETLKTHRKMKRPLHDYFPFDFIAESIWPGRIVDSYQWQFELEEHKPVDRAELIKAAQELKEQASIELAKPLDDDK